VASLEVLVVLMKEDMEFTSSLKSISNLISLIAGKLDENPKNMDVIMPSIAVILAMRDKNYDATMEALRKLNQKQKS
jgi:hypothetical protein